jgi:CDP-glucose 4,6-dehydratase
VSEGWNFGPGDEGAATVAAVTERLSRALGSDGSWARDTVVSPPESHVLRIDSSKARGALAWRPRLSAHETVDWTAEWSLGWRGGADPRALCLEQLKKYEMKR